MNSAPRRGGRAIALGTTAGTAEGTAAAGFGVAPVSPGMRSAGAMPVAAVPFVVPGAVLGLPAARSVPAPATREGAVPTPSGRSQGRAQGLARSRLRAAGGTR